jgi:ATP-dependent Clp protease ATP-binding subunit ClpB
MTIGAARSKVLDLSLRNPNIGPLIGKFAGRVVGQPEPVEVLIDITVTHLSGLGDPERPAGTAMFLGPTGTGKTHIAEMLCEGLFGDKHACIKVDCAEFQHSHEIAKLIGSPPGYLGHRETHPILTQEALNQYHMPGFEISVLLFDEIEKASDALWQLMLGILDKATLTLGDNRVVNLSKVIIILTSNLGGKAMQDLISGGFGFHPEKGVAVSDEKNADVALEAAKRHFTPEFMNRIDHVVTFHTLTESDIREVMGMELGALQQFFWAKSKFLYQLSNAAKDTIMKEGYSNVYGARELKRAIEKRVRLPLCRLISSKQITAGDIVVVDDKGGKDFEFTLTNLRDTQVTFKDFTEEILG